MCQCLYICIHTYIFIYIHYNHIESPRWRTVLKQNITSRFLFESIDQRLIDQFIYLFFSLTCYYYYRFVIELNE